MADYKINNFYQGGYSTLDPNKAYSNTFTGYRVPITDLSISTNPQTANQIKEVTDKLSSGLKQIDLTLIQPKMVELVSKEQLQEINRLSKLTGIGIDVHGPVSGVNTSGLGQQGYEESDRKHAEDIIINTLEKSSHVNPDGNINVTFHTSDGIPGSEWKAIGNKEDRQFKKMMIVDRSTGQMVNALKDEVKFYPGGPEGFIKKEKSPEKLLEELNGSKWEDDLDKVIIQKEMGDRILSENPSAPEITQLYYALQDKENKGMFNKLPKSQQQVILNLQVADTHLHETQRTISSLFTKAYEHGDEHTKKILAQAGKNFQKNLYGIEAEDVSKLSKEQQQIAMMNQHDFQNRSRALQLFAEDLKSANPDFFVPLEDFATEKVSQTFGNAAFKTYEKFKDKAPIISIENPPVGHALATGEDLRNVIKGSRKTFAERLVKEKNINEKEANKIAEKLIGATWDVGHINILRKQGFGKEDIIKESEKIRPYLKHVHLSDNFGLEHTELPMGMGNVPFKEIMEKLGKEGFEAKKLIEAGDWWQQQMNPVQASLEGLGAPIYANGQTPYWNQSPGLFQGYNSGLEGNWLPGVNYQTFGTYFSQLPTELGGSAQGAGSRMSGRGME